MTAPTVLEKIAASVRKRMEARLSQVSLSEMRDRCDQARKPFDFKAAFAGAEAPSARVLAEIKFSSPSQGQLAGGSVDRAVEVARDYLSSGAVALSVLTEQDHFHGSHDYLRAVRKAFPEARLLLKDFVVDEYQLLEARAIGADAALLIVALLGEQRTRELSACARAIGLTALVEVHDEAEMEIAVRVGADLIGVNNRNLKTLEISLDVSERLARLPHGGACLISESGLSEGPQLSRLRRLGYSGFLIGTTFMKTGSPGAALARLIAEVEDAR